MHPREFRLQNIDARARWGQMVKLNCSCESVSFPSPSGNVGPEFVPLIPIFSHFVPFLRLFHSRRVRFRSCERDSAFRRDGGFSFRSHFVPFCPFPLFRA